MFLYAYFVKKNVKRNNMSFVYMRTNNKNVLVFAGSLVPQISQHDEPTELVWLALTAFLCNKGSGIAYHFGHLRNITRLACDYA